MYTDTTKELLESIIELEDIKAKTAKGSKPKQTKTKLNYLFNKKTQNLIREIASMGLTDGFNESEIARAAMYIGLKELMKASEKDNHLRGLLHISRIRNKFE